MKSETGNRIKLGIFVSAGVLLLVIGLYLIGNQQNMFSSTISIFTHFENVSGLRVGNNVRFSGIDIGTVKNIEIKSPKNIRVEMIIDAEVVHFINKNSMTSLGTDGLMGNRLINIEPGTQSALEIESGDELPSKENINTDKMLETLNKTNSNVAVVSEDLRKITNNLNNGRGTFYSLLMDTTMAKDVHKTFDNINSISENLKMFSNDLMSMTTNIKDGKGLIGSLLEDSNETSRQFNQSLHNIEIASNQFSEFSKNLSLMMDSVRSSKGMASVLLYDTIAAQQLKNSMANIDSSAVKLNVYMNALRESFLFRKYFRKEDKKNK
ncbi:MAG: MCE family protein [Bacteroidia bacterium]|nr:MCE family protein [Bacteroidia bacterium]